jgi:hypothetical protein
LKAFKLQYDPAKAWPGGVARRVLGSKPLELGVADVLSAKDVAFPGMDETHLTLVLKGPSEGAGAGQAGPTIRVYRDSGEISLHTAGTDLEKFSWAVLLDLFQNAIGYKSRAGVWRAD